MLGVAFLFILHLPSNTTRMIIVQLAVYMPLDKCVYIVYNVYIEYIH